MRIIEITIIITMITCPFHSISMIASAPAIMRIMKPHEPIMIPGVIITFLFEPYMSNMSIMVSMKTRTKPFHAIRPAEQRIVIILAIVLIILHIIIISDSLIPMKTYAIMDI